MSQTPQYQTLTVIKKFKLKQGSIILSHWMATVNLQGEKLE